MPQKLETAFLVLLDNGVVSALLRPPIALPALLGKVRGLRVQLIVLIVQEVVGAVKGLSRPPRVLLAPTGKLSELR